MESSEMSSVLFLFVINITFMVLGMFLNFVVILSLWRLTALRRKLCYFMILVLSCFDMAVVTVTHPFLIVSLINFSEGKTNRIVDELRIVISFFLYGSSMFALFTLNAERFLALNCPFFHQASLTRRRLIFFLSFLMVTVLGLSSSLCFNRKTSANIFTIVFHCVFLILFIYLNYKTFKVAKSKRDEQRNASTSSTTTNEARKEWMLNLKNVSTCSLAVGCFFVCSCPQIIISSLRLASQTSYYDRQVYLSNLWSCTFASLNSTFNCLIFFWKNSILRQEGIKIVKAYKLHIFA